MDWVAFIRNTPPKVVVPRFKGAAGVFFGFRQRASYSKTLLEMIRH